MKYTGHNQLFYNIGPTNVLINCFRCNTMFSARKDFISEMRRVTVWEVRVIMRNTTKTCSSQQKIFISDKMWLEIPCWLVNLRRQRILFVSQLVMASLLIAISHHMDSRWTHNTGAFCIISLSIWIRLEYFELSKCIHEIFGYHKNKDLYQYPFHVHTQYT